MIDIVIAFIGGALFGVVLSVIFFCAVLMLVAKDPKGERSSSPTQKEPPTNKALMEFCNQQAEMSNFWTYDGSAQRNSAEIAQDLFDKEVVKRGRR